VGLYYSLIDWNHPDFVIDSVHPLRNHPDRAMMNEARDQKRYVELLHGQVRELLTDYGDVDMLFFDFTYPEKFHWPPGMEDDWRGKTPEDWDSVGLMRMVREIAPHVAVNDRLGINHVEGGWDFVTPEQFEPRRGLTRNGRRVPWAAVQTFSGSWGYHRDESTWKSVEQLVRMLVNTVSNGGSMILNVGPTGRGEFDARAMDRLRGMGEWMRRHGRSIYGCTYAPEDFPTPQDCRYTWNPETKRLYCHVYAWPSRRLRLDGLADRVEYAQILGDASEVKLGLGAWYASQEERSGGSDTRTLTLELPVRKPDVAVPVIELFLKG
jgi:alpha-L-fucosidase